MMAADGVGVQTGRGKYIKVQSSHDTLIKLNNIV